MGRRRWPRRLIHRRAGKVRRRWQGFDGIIPSFHYSISSLCCWRERDGRVRNKALVFSPAGELLAFYAKMRPFTLGGESQHYVEGEHPITFRWRDWTVSPFICYDLRFPEIFREAARTHKPELFAVI